MHERLQFTVSFQLTIISRIMLKIQLIYPREEALEFFPPCLRKDGEGGGCPEWGYLLRLQLRANDH